MNVLGISAFYHDSAACLVRDGVIVAAAEEERFSRLDLSARPLKMVARADRHPAAYLGLIPVLTKGSALGHSSTACFSALS